MVDNRLILISIMSIFVLIVPISGVIMLDNFSYLKIVSIALHTFFEVSGSILAFMVSILVLNKESMKNFHLITIALSSMATIDLIHALVVENINTFVWLHSISMLIGSTLFLLSFIKVRRFGKKFIFLVIFGSLLLSIFSILFGEILPIMVEDGKFKNIAIYINIVSGIFFISTSINYLSKYNKSSNIDYLLFFGHTTLFGISGLIFMGSELWNLTWWFWHIVRFIAYFIIFYYSYNIFAKSTKLLQQKELELSDKNATLRKSLAISLEYQKALETGSIVSKADRFGNITYINERFSKLTGYESKELIGHSHSIFRHLNTPKEIYADMWSTIEKKDIWKGVLKNIKKNGDSFYTNTTIVPILSEHSEIKEYIAFREDITELVKSKEELRKIFYTDSLTSLGNRFKLINDIQSYKQPILGILNIDAFGEINDFYGQRIGDVVISELANFIFERVDFNRYKLYRLQGDEFALLSDLNRVKEMEFTHKIKELITETKGKIFQIQELDINIHITAGISKGSSDDIIENADLSLKTARATKADFIIYNSELKTSKEYQNNLIWTSKIKKAVTEDRVVAFFQPIYDYKLNKITKVESLVRIIDEDGTIVSPFFFLNIAKKSKLYFHITKIMFEKMIIKMKEYPELNFSINISSDDIMNSDVKEFIIKTIESNNIGSRVIFEIVESEGIESFEEMEHFINWIKSVGGQLAIDDFGSGYSNFSYLMKLESNFIKIDGSMISQLIEGKNSLSVVETIVNFAKKNNILTIAEFVSSKELFDMVRLLGIDFAQGYYINKPSDIIDLKPKFK